MYHVCKASIEFGKRMDCGGVVHGGMLEEEGEFGQREDGTMGLGVGGGWVPACARTRDGGEGRLWAEKMGVGEGMGPRVREDKGGAYGCEIPRGTRNEMWVEGEENHPIPSTNSGQALTFPHQGGREKRLRGIIRLHSF